MKRRNPAIGFNLQTSRDRRISLIAHERKNNLKKNLVLALLIINLASAYSLNFNGIDRWIRDYPNDKSKFLDYGVDDCVIEDSGVLLVLKKNNMTVKLSLINPTSMEKLTGRIRIIENIILNAQEYRSDKWNISIDGVEINSGLNDDITVTLRISSFVIKLNKETSLELISKLEKNPIFNYQVKGDNFLYSMKFKDIDTGYNSKEIFPGWTEYAERIIKWFQNELNVNDQETLALVYSTKVMKVQEKELEKKILLSKNDRSNIWIGINIDHFAPNLLSGEVDGIYFNPFTYQMIEPMLSFSFRKVGLKAWLAKPFDFDVFVGGFFEINSSYYVRNSKGDFDGYTTKNGSFLVAGGPSFGSEFSIMMPRIVNDKYTGDLFGIGFEFITCLNAPYFSKDYKYEYFLNQFFNIVFHVIPNYKYKLDIIAGFNVAFATMDFDETKPVVLLSKCGLTIGARLKIDIFNFYKSVDMYK
jgi:hypothetical protein